LKAFVIKPSITGGISHTVRIAQHGRKTGAATIISTAYESRMGLYGLAALASWLGNEESAHGLGTGDLFEEDPCPQPFVVHRGIVPASTIDARPPEPATTRILKIDV
jgi:O-succinylbenzoate synthase